MEASDDFRKPNMTQLFSERESFRFRKLILSAPLLLVCLLSGVIWFEFSPYTSLAGTAPEQPIPFSHKHHVSQLGIDCRYCHVTVETSAKASLPSTDVCLNCHREIHLNSPLLNEVHSSYRLGKSIPWVRVYKLPAFVYFDHSVHVQNGVLCSECHGDVANMAITRQETSLQMQWCVECHRKKKSLQQKMLLSDDRDIDGLKPRTDCTTCHR